MARWLKEAITVEERKEIDEQVRSVVEIRWPILNRAVTKRSVKCLPSLTVGARRSACPRRISKVREPTI